MRAIIPVAGIGTRMRPHTHTQPKVLLQVADKPMLDHIIDGLVEAGITGVTLVLGYLGDRIREHVTKHYGHLDLHFVEQHEMLGLGHAIWLTREIHRNDDRLLIILGDTIVQMDYKGMFALPCGSLAVKEVEDARRFGVVQLDGDRITRLVEKADNPPTNLAIVGVYLMDDPKLLFAGLDHIIEKNIRTKNEYQLTDALQYMIEHGNEMRPFRIDGWLDCGKPETLLETNQILLSEHCTEEKLAEYRARFPHVVFIPPVYIGPDCRLEQAVIGPHVSIAKNCHIERSILSDCTIAKNASLKGLRMSNSMVGEFAEASSAPLSLNIGDHSAITLG
ncbi:MAG: sugar phosphate nucleotidyltransferase [Candidatus Sumerlaeia bacterium]|nr:sugar phosphate nucleotidyltransferase [Candidatus Sumerlaeia bacterium]